MSDEFCACGFQELRYLHDCESEGFCAIVHTHTFTILIQKTKNNTEFNKETKNNSYLKLNPLCK